MADILNPPNLPTDDDSWVLEAKKNLDKMREKPLEASVNYGVKQNPGVAAKVQSLAKEYNIPVSFAEKKTEDLDLASRRKKIVKSLKGTPILRELMKDARFAAVVHGDVDALVEMENESYAGKYAKGIGTEFAIGSELARQGIATQFRHLAEGVDAYLSYDENPRFEKGVPRSQQDIKAMTDYAAAQEVLEEARPGFTSETESAVYSGIASLARQLPGMGAAVVTGGAAGVGIGLGYIGAMTSGETYLKYLERGGTRAEALAGSFSETSIEILTELIPMSFFVNKFGKAGLAQFIGGIIAREVPTELLATTGQEFVDTMIANPDKSLADYKNELPAQLYHTFIATLAHAGLAGSLSIPARVAASRYGDNLDAAQRASDNAEQLDRQVEIALKSETRTLDPEKYKQHLDALFDESDTVHMEPDDARAFFEEHPETMDYFPAERQQEIRETLDEDFDVGITRSELLTYLPEFYEEVKALVRSDIDGMTLAEIETAPIDREGFAGVAEIALDEMDQAIQAEESGQKIFESFKQQSIEAGVSRRDSNVGATLVKNFSMILSDKLDQDAGQPFNTPESVFSAAGNLQVQHGTITKNEDGTVNIEAAIKAGQLDGVMLDEVDVEMDNGDFKSIEMPAELAFDEAKKKTDALQKLQDCING